MKNAKAQVIEYLTRIISFRVILSYAMYRVIQDKLENCRWLFETENMDRFLIKRYFWYRKSGKFHMVPWKIRKNVTRHSKSMLMLEFPFWNNRFLLVLYTVCYDFDRDFECLARFFSEFWLIRHKIPPFNSLPNIKFW